MTPSPRALAASAREMVRRHAERAVEQAEVHAAVCRWRKQGVRCSICDELNLRAARSQQAIAQPGKEAERAADSQRALCQRGARSMPELSGASGRAWAGYPGG